ncbi:MAG: redoxin domain-containing protein [Candidatus Aminicenantia bacterium]
MKRILCFSSILIASCLFSQEFSLTFRKYEKPKIVSEMEKRLENVYNLEERIIVVQKYLKKYPENILIHRTYQDLMRIHDHQKLYNEYKILFNKNKNNPMFIYLFGRIQERGEDAKAFFEKAIEKDRSFYWGYIGLSYYYSNELSPPDLPKAEELLKKAISIDNSQPEAFINLHSIYTRQRKYELADTVSDILMKMNSEDDGIFLISLNRFKRTGEINRIVSAIEDRVKERGEKPDLLLFLSNTYIEMGDIEKGINKLEKFGNLYPKHPLSPQVFYNLSILYSRKFNKAKTLEHLNRAFSEGYNLKPWIEELPNFSFIRNEKEFKDLLGRINEKIGIGKKVKHFVGKDIGGELIDIRKLEGSVVLVCFWALWCDPCKAEIPFLKEEYKKFNKKGFEIIGVSLDSDRDSLSSFISKGSINWKNIFTGKGKGDPIAKIFQIDSIPSNLLIDRKGILRYVDLRGEVLSRRIEELIKEK